MPHTGSTALACASGGLFKTCSARRFPSLFDSIDCIYTRTRDRHRGFAMALLWWWRILRFAVLGRLPRTADDVMPWALCVPFRQWHRACREDGRTFADI